LARYLSTILESNKPNSEYKHAMSEKTYSVAEPSCDKRNDFLDCAFRDRVHARAVMSNALPAHDSNWHDTGRPVTPSATAFRRRHPDERYIRAFTVEVGARDSGRLTTFISCKRESLVRGPTGTNILLPDGKNYGSFSLNDINTTWTSGTQARGLKEGPFRGRRPSVEYYRHLDGPVKGVLDTRHRKWGVIGCSVDPGQTNAFKRWRTLKRNSLHSLTPRGDVVLKEREETSCVFVK
ncbi:hypothetical protein BaRGS_00033290, partial [Batillaria attramentaria]